MSVCGNRSCGMREKSFESKMDPVRGGWQDSGFLDESNGPSATLFPATRASRKTKV